MPAESLLFIARLPNEDVYPEAAGRSLPAAGRDLNASARNAQPSFAVFYSAFSVSLRFVFFLVQDVRRSSSSLCVCASALRALCVEKSRSTSTAIFRRLASLCRSHSLPSLSPDVRNFLYPWLSLRNELSACANSSSPDSSFSFSSLSLSLSTSTITNGSFPSPPNAASILSRPPNPTSVPPASSTTKTVRNATVRPAKATAPKLGSMTRSPPISSTPGLLPTSPTAKSSTKSPKAAAPCPASSDASPKMSAGNLSSSSVPSPLRFFPTLHPLGALLRLPSPDDLFLRKSSTPPRLAFIGASSSAEGRLECVQMWPKNLNLTRGLTHQSNVHEILVLLGLGLLVLWTVGPFAVFVVYHVPSLRRFLGLDASVK